jgi:hypothetical protein
LKSQKKSSVEVMCILKNGNTFPCKVSKLVLKEKGKDKVLQEMVNDLAFLGDIERIEFKKKDKRGRIVTV